MLFLYTSGTTGKPRGAIRMSGSLVLLAYLAQVDWGLSRSTYITVHMENVKDDCKSDYEKQNVGADKLGQYDYDSIMHYPKKNDNRAKNPAKEIIETDKVIGQRTKLSDGDRAVVKAMYP